MSSFGVMFHHFHGDYHKPSQGSINKNDFERIIDYLQSKYLIINANSYLKKIINKSLKPNEICLTFDDALRSQYDIAIPILRQRNISAFFFIYSSVFSNNPSKLEIYRYFRSNYFQSIDQFYSQFFDIVKTNFRDKYNSELEQYKSLNYLSHFPFYTNSDKWFRYLRDVVLKEYNYDQIMLKIMNKCNFDKSSASKKLWIKTSQLKEMHQEGHIIGLHSYSHPTKIDNLPYQQQNEEYQKNLYHLKKVLNVEKIESMSHPCGRYNGDTLDILKDIGIKVGFRSNMSIKETKNSLEIPREDHSNILSRIK
ncbi:polysaccharide deacetylase family protein [Prochlorococcus marinus]|jgi:peptidoglycan/xylan/chitin deacetylase (PgdA/CDA1 family)|uniref:NodB homology domain-containing protein n=1 Tax=Prochlorococcus marinus (strain MIT 9301) TaxID=167546 RepID=A3PE83_PROM0|nr:polysaccharide deacetylase family protein [Prochlorococcus marinus]ABO18058.1 Hypothetical protein P9301_14351 [Prochlorococcus marinus str. MIT 9301]